MFVEVPAYNDECNCAETDHGDQCNAQSDLVEVGIGGAVVGTGVTAARA
jgi:aspartate ammonia-lyase